MIQTRLWVLATIIAVVIIVGFVLSVPHTRDIIEQKVEQSAPVVPTVGVHDVYRKGTHTLSGSVTAPNACTVVTADATLSGDASSTQVIMLTLSMPEDAGVCLQVPTPISFSANVAAPLGAPIEATVNGQKAEVEKI